MPEKRKLKIKDKNTIFVRPRSQIANILRVLSVSGEIGCSSLKLFGVGGEREGYTQYGRIKRLMLSDVEYKDVDGEEIAKGVMFTVCGVGQLKRLRVSNTGDALFEPLGLGERFREFYFKKNLSGDPKAIKRNIRLAEWCIFCQRVGVEFNPAFTPKVYNLGSGDEKKYGPHPKEPYEITEKIFYPSKEIKTRDERASKYGNGSRVTGVLVSPEKMELCFWIPPTRLVWDVNVELSFESYLKNDFGPQNFGFPFDPTQKFDLLCIAKSFPLSEQVIFKPAYSGRGKAPEKKNLSDSTLFKDLYKDIYVFPDNENGIRQFKFHNIPNLKETLLDFYIRNPQAVADASSCTFQCDAYDKSKNIATVFFYDGCVTKLQSCVVGKSTDYARGENAVKLRIYCFPWQTQYIKDKFAGIKGVTIIDDDYEKVYGIISRRAQKGDGAK